MNNHNPASGLEEAATPESVVVVHITGWLRIPEGEIPHPAADPESFAAAITGFIASRRMSLRVTSTGDMVTSTPTGNDLAPWLHTTWGPDGSPIKERQSTITNTGRTGSPFRLTLTGPGGEQRLLGEFADENVANNIHYLWTHGLLQLDVQGLPVLAAQEETA